MFAHELQQARNAELRRRAEEWRLVQAAKAARTAQRRTRTQARRVQSHTAVRQDAEGVPSSDRSGAGPLGHVHQVMHPHSTV